MYNSTPQNEILKYKSKKYALGLYEENYKTPMNKNDEDFDLQIQCNPNKYPINLFVNTDKLILKFIWRGEKSRIANMYYRKTTKLEE